MNEKEETYTGWLTSPNILKRAFAVWGHYMIANIIIGLGCMAVVLLGLLVLGNLVD